MRRPTEQLHRYNICGRPTFYCSVFSLPKRQSPWNSCIGDKLLQGLCLLNMYHNLSLFRGNPYRKYGFFRCGETAGLPAFHFSDRHPICQKTGPYHIHHDVILQRSGVFIAAWSRNCSVPLSLHVFYNKEWNTSVSSGWTRDPCEWIPGPEKDGHL